MKKEKIIHLDFVIDKLTNSIQNTISGDGFPTDVSRFLQTDLKQVNKKNGWNFNWKEELDSNSREVYKLTIPNNPTIIQGLLSFTVKTDHLHMNLLESAPFNIGRNKIYEGVPGNLVAYACKISFQNGFNGFISFTAKTKLIEHYEKSLGAYHFGNHLMIIPTEVAQELIDKYFKKLDTMGHIKEPEGVDFIIESRPLTKEEEAAISKYIRTYTAKHSKKKAAAKKKKELPA